MGLVGQGRCRCNWVKLIYRSTFGTFVTVRQPIVSVLGHVDHGKSTILDRIRGTKVVAREAGGITQHIGATDVPMDAIYSQCRGLTGDREFSVPGLLFIDTPGHYSFVSLRSRGGALADLVVLVIDINEGMKPQTIESINILKKLKTPFVVVANKIDLIPGWRAQEDTPIGESIRLQDPRVVAEMDEKIYALAGRLYEVGGFSADRFDKISDFTKSVAIVPVSGKTGEGLPDLLLVLIGLAQRFLGSDLSTEDGPGEGSVLEVKEDKGIGTTIDTIVYHGTMAVGDTIVISSVGGAPIQTKIRALLRPKPLDEIRDPSKKFDQVKSVSAAAGIRIVAPDLEDAMAGGQVRVAGDDVEEVVQEVQRESAIQAELSEQGIIVRGDTIGSLEALAFEADKEELPIRKISLGKVSRKDVIEASNFDDPLHRAIFAFNVEINPDARDAAREMGVRLFENQVVYRLLEDYQLWCDERSRELEVQSRLDISFPGKISILRDHVFRVSKPAIVGVRVLAGRIRQGQFLMRNDGRTVGRIKSIRSGEKTLREARMGDEVAIAIDDVTVGRQIEVEDVLLVDIPESHVAKLAGQELSVDEREILDKVIEIRRKESPFWGS
ncbi:MAG: translation initiation factor IF-2 [Methanobacteriota archaeon]|nr:MAG: translation initiation factor IF-2 [Euryarchaeota archaeon]